MEKYKIISIGDNVCDKYLSRGIMYPGGQCVNTSVYAKMNNVDSSYLGKFGNDEVARCVQDTLDQIGIDYSRSKYFEGENGFALVTLNNGDRVFLGSNKGGIAQDNSFDFTQEDMKYIGYFDLIYTNLNSYIEQDLATLHGTSVPIAFDFSTRWTDEYLDLVCPYVTIAILSCAHLTDEQREIEMKKVQNKGVSIILGTVGEDGSYVLYKDLFFYTPAIKAENIKDTMGAGDSYFATFLCSLLTSSNKKGILNTTTSEMNQRIIDAMAAGAKFAADICVIEGAFGYGVPILGDIVIK